MTAAKRWLYLLVFVMLVSLSVVCILLHTLSDVWQYHQQLHYVSTGVFWWSKVQDRDIVPDNTRHNVCEVPSSGGFKAWRQGIVTVLNPEIERDCDKLFASDQVEVDRIIKHSKEWSNSLSDEEFYKRTKNCSWVKSYFMNNLYTTKLERSLPLAYIFVVYNSAQQVVRLFRYLYRQHNYYCFHPDVESGWKFAKMFLNIAECLDNVFIASRRESVKWGHFSLMDAQLNCLEDLLHYREVQSPEKRWQYVINVCGKELPLVTTHQIVSHLVKLNGTSLLSVETVSSKDKETISRLKEQKVPFNLTFYKSVAYNALSYKFVDFLFTNKTALAVREFFRTSCEIPEEHFYATLYMAPGVPGGHNPNINIGVNVINCFWVCKSCHPVTVGLVVHQISIVSVRDLRAVAKGASHGFFHNKYFMEHDHTVMDCMEERLVRLNREEYQSDCEIAITPLNV